MGKLTISILTIFCLSCTLDEPEYYYGNAKVQVIDGKESYSLLKCGCWQTEDSVSVYISGGEFAGFAINVTNKGGKFRSLMEYYSDA